MSATRATKPPLTDEIRAALDESTSAPGVEGVAACHRCATYTTPAAIKQVDGVPTCPACREETEETPA